MNIMVKDAIGENCISYPSGKAILDRILPELRAGNEVTLNFSGVSVFASPFFNMAIGTLFKEFSREDLSSRLHFEGLNEAGKTILKRVIENSEKYYALPKSKKEEFDSAINEEEEF